MKRTLCALLGIAFLLAGCAGRPAEVPTTPTTRDAVLEEQLAALSRKLENPPPDPSKVQRLGTEYVKVERELEERMQEWEQLGA